jgi:hypothetical protein
MHTAQLKEQAKMVVAQRHAEHEWTEGIASWIERCDATPETRRDFLTTRDIFVEALSSNDRSLDRRSALSVAQVMRTLGWGPKVRWVGGRPVRGYERGGGAVFNVDDVAAML